jgi:hypothetical protein
MARNSQKKGVNSHIPTALRLCLEGFYRDCFGVQL